MLDVLTVYLSSAAGLPFFGRDGEESNQTGIFMSGQKNNSKLLSSRRMSRNLPHPFNVYNEAAEEMFSMGRPVKMSSPVRMSIPVRMNRPMTYRDTVPRQNEIEDRLGAKKIFEILGGFIGDVVGIVISEVIRKFGDFVGDIVRYGVSSVSSKVLFEMGKVAASTIFSVKRAVMTI